jgi:hypothetical protein
MCDYVWVRHHRSPSRSLNSIEGPELALCDWQLVSAMQKSGNSACRDNTARTNLNFTQGPLNAFRTTKMGEIYARSPMPVGTVKRLS